MNGLKRLQGLAPALKAGARGLAVLTALLGAIAGTGLAQSGQSEYAVKAAFIYNFAKYVEWPSSALSPAAAILVIGVYGSDPCAKQIEDAIGGKSVDGRKVIIKRFSSAKAAEEAHILFVPQSSAGRIGELSGLKSRGTLIVGETAGFARKHGHIGFALERSRLTFEISERAAKTSGLTISSKLLQLAKRVD